MRACRKLTLGVFQPAGAAYDDVHAGDEADKGAAEYEQAGDVGLLLLGAQRGQPTRELQLLAFDERFGDLPDVIGGGASRALIERRDAAVELEGHDRRIQLVSLLARGDAHCGALAAPVR